MKNDTEAQKWLVLISVGLGTFMSALDASVVNVTLPTITASFESHVTVTEWVVTIYLLVVSILLLAFGRLGDLQGHKRVYTLGFILFIASSVLCGLAGSPGMLIGFRALQALGAAMLFANSPALLTQNFPPNQRGQALGMQATLTYLGLTVGPSLGGWITEQVGWQGIFFINVPIGLLALFFCLRFIPDDRHTSAGQSFDWKGALLFAVGLVALLVLMNQGQNWGWLSLPAVGLLLLAAAFLVWFVSWERRSPAPMLDLQLFSRQTFSFSVISALLNYVSLYAIIFLLPFYLIEGRGFSPAQTGLILTAQPIVMAVTAPISGTLSDRFSPRWLSTLGMGILAVGLWQLSRLGPASSIQMVVLALATAGLGTGMFISPNTSVLLGSAPRNRQGIASGILATSRNVGMVLGVGLAGAIYTTILARGQAGSLFTAVQASFLNAMGIAALGALSSYIRGDAARQT